MSAGLFGAGVIVLSVFVFALLLIAVIFGGDE